MPNVRNLPVGTVGWNGSSTRENLQEDVFITCDSRLVAVNVGPDGTYGSLVYDTNQNNEYDAERSAYLQSAFRVLKHPLGDANAIAFQLNRSGNGETKGGWFVDKGDGSSSTQSTGAGNVATSGSGMVATTGQGQAVKAGAAPEEVVTTPGKAGIVVGQGSYTDNGPFHVGNKTDKHNHGADADGNPINALHIWTGALFYRNQVEDGPLRFEKIYKQGEDKSIVVPVHLAWSGSDWAWWSTTDTYHPDYPYNPSIPTNPGIPTYPTYPSIPTGGSNPIPTGGGSPGGGGVPTGGGGGGQPGGGFTPFTGDLPGVPTGHTPIVSGGDLEGPWGGGTGTPGIQPTSPTGGDLSGGAPTGYVPISSGGPVGGGGPGSGGGGTPGGGSSGGDNGLPPSFGIDPSTGRPYGSNPTPDPIDDPSAGDQGDLFATQTPPNTGNPPGGGANPGGGSPKPFDNNPNPPPKPKNFDLPFDPGGTTFDMAQNSQAGKPFNMISIAGALNTTAQTFQAQNYNPGSSDSGAFTKPNSQALSKSASTSPLTGAMSSFAAQGGSTSAGVTASGSPFPANTSGAQGDPWVYTATPRGQSFGGAPRSRYKSGTANGGIVYHPVETDLRDVGNGMKPSGVTLNTFLVMTAPGAYFGCGVPELVNGGIKSGYRWGVDSTNGDLVFYSISSSQAAIEAMRFGNTTQRISFASQMGVNGTLAHNNTSARTWTFQDASGYVICSSGNVGFYGTTPGAQKTVTGSRAGNAALASLLTQLAGYGLIVDGTVV